MNITAEQAARSHESKSELTIGVISGLMALAILLVGLRLRCRRLAEASGWDDIAAVLGLACCLGCGASIIAMTHYGLGKHDWTLTPEQLVLYGRCFWLSILFYSISLYWVKLSFLLQYYRILSISNMRWACLGAIIFITLWSLSQTIVLCLICVPLEAVWDPSVEGKCLSHQTQMWYVNGVMHIVLDFVIIIMPLPIVWNLNLPRSQKWLLSGIFGLGVFTVTISIFRLRWLTPQPDVTWWNVTAASWSLAEIVSGIACSCLPTFKPLLLGIKRWLPRLGKGDSTIQLQGTNGTAYTESTLIGTDDTFGSGPKVPNSMFVYGTQTSITAHKDSEPCGRFKRFMQR
ncbi:Ff.00g038390.m01.CDS01 [Fusarium sp. VM40]|nr:Ff.00g038390.m01.CDS01 [Fusarium sp. VM40]